MRVLFEDYDWFRYQRINDFINVAWKLIWQFREKKKMGKMIDFYDIFKKIIAIDEEILNWNELEKSVSCKLIHCLYVKICWCNIKFSEIFWKSFNSSLFN